ncbi:MULTISPECIES: SMP-30/gluconolactonase/LRE family protein [Sorangium]|uniref:Gluconolactonase n=1 Tax=Sorangium cellulosum TaxID=56 RepID=A0A4V0NG73_SORCE|nr:MULTISPECIES: SMP-30/gluconolactonase/LRE family protein [Sorangium]AUX32172.1 gluconolactonase [Sorangium cellulosum]WCQ91543.1 6-deoxy-6-sulfogluconolactonase [Sorangium sp. Soce836]
MSSVRGFTLDPARIEHVGQGLVRPECVIAEADGTLWTSDARGIATRIDPDGRQATLGPDVGEPNGMAMDRQGNLIVAALSGGKVYKLHRDGRSEVLLDSIDGMPLGAVNFCFVDSRDRLWISVLTRQLPWWLAVAGNIRDGYIVLVDEKGPRIVADNLSMTNEVRLDADEKFLYAVETIPGRLLRFPVRDDGSLGDPEQFGPDSLGIGGYMDGFAFDAEGNIWVAAVCRNGLSVVFPDGSHQTVFEDPRPAVLEAMILKQKSGTIEPADLGACAGDTVQLPTSITFGGPDLRTCYMGSLAMPRLLTFRAPVAGLPLAHLR